MWRFQTTSMIGKGWSPPLFLCAGDCIPALQGAGRGGQPTFTAVLDLCLLLLSVSERRLGELVLQLLAPIDEVVNGPWQV